MVVDNLPNPSGRSELIGEMTFVWTCKGRKASESFNPRILSCFEQSFKSVVKFPSSVTEKVQNSKYSKKWGEVELGVGEETNLIYFINMMVSLFNLPRQGVFGLWLLPLWNINGFQGHHCHWMNGLEETIGTNGFSMVFGLSTIGPDGFLVWQPLGSMVLRWFLVWQPLDSMVFQW